MLNPSLRSVAICFLLSREGTRKAFSEWVEVKNILHKAVLDIVVDECDTVES